MDNRLHRTLPSFHRNQQDCLPGSAHLQIRDNDWMIGKWKVKDIVNINSAPRGFTLSALHDM